MSQKKIAKQLKVFTTAVGIAGLFIFTVLGMELKSQYSSGSFAAALVLLAVTAVICYLVLYRFWTVCSEIGRDNSFSHENGRAFSIMAGLLAGLSVFWLLFFAGYLILAAEAEFFTAFKLLVMTLVWLGISALCAALARLIEKAREIREENDLTI